MCICIYICIYAHILYWSTAMIYLELLSPFFRLDCVVFLRPSPSVFIKFASTSPPSRKRFCYLIRSKKNAKLILACHVQIQIWTAHARDARWGSNRCRSQWWKRSAVRNLFKTQYSTIYFIIAWNAICVEHTAFNQKRNTQIWGYHPAPVKRHMLRTCSRIWIFKSISPLFNGRTLPQAAAWVWLCTIHSPLQSTMILKTCLLSSA